ncbi:MAG: hypothetical protein JSR73_04700 [Proteobacteria bacterium]|nr:hypothetical protein [Pseudomonadota bacterium]
MHPMPPAPSKVTDLAAFRRRRRPVIGYWDGRVPVYSRTARQFLFSLEAAISICRHRQLAAEDLDLLVAEEGPRPASAARVPRYRRVAIAPELEHHFPAAD